MCIVPKLIVENVITCGSKTAERCIEQGSCVHDGVLYISESVSSQKDTMAHAIATKIFHSNPSLELIVSILFSQPELFIKQFFAARGICDLPSLEATGLYATTVPIPEHPVQQVGQCLAWSGYEFRPSDAEAMPPKEDCAPPEQLEQQQPAAPEQFQQQGLTHIEMRVQDVPATFNLEESSSRNTKKGKNKKAKQKGKGRINVLSWTAVVEPRTVSGIAPMEKHTLPKDLMNERRMHFAPSALQEIGRWGEHFVADQLGARADTVLEWVNQDSESGMPFDIVRRCAQTDQVMEYVEVKTTTASSMDTPFEISANELQWMVEHSSLYTICRVFDAGKPSAYFSICKDPVQMIRDRSLGVQMQIL